MSGIFAVSLIAAFMFARAPAENSSPPVSQDESMCKTPYTVMAESTTVIEYDAQKTAFSGPKSRFGRSEHLAYMAVVKTIETPIFLFLKHRAQICP